MDGEMMLVVLEYTYPRVYIFHIPEDTDIQDFLFVKKGFKESQIYWMAGNPTIEIYSDREL